MSHTPLLNLLWRAGHLAGRGYTSITGESVLVVSPGHPADEDETGAPEGVWNGAVVVVDGVRRSGPVAVGERTPVPPGGVLRIVQGYAPPVLGLDDRLVTQIVHNIEPELIGCYDGLRAGAASCECAQRIAALDTLRRTELFTSLSVERLRRKTGRISRLFEASNSDWNQTFHILLMQAMGGDRNREAFTTLAERATWAMVSREKSSPHKVEALLLGAAGFLFAGCDGTGDLPKDDYTLRLEEEFRHLAAKHSIVPLKPGMWETTGIRTANHPALRLAQIAALLAKKDFMLDGVLGCRGCRDVEELFGIAASEYWNTHYKPGAEHGFSPKRIGREKARLVGINLAVPLMFAYGRQTGSETLCEAALDLLATIPPERNRKLEGWYARGCVPASAFESQALLELTGEWCSPGACASCRIGRGEIKKALQGLTSAING